MERAELPTRRNEAWRYSDLRAALDDCMLPPASPIGGRSGAHVIEVLASGLGALQDIHVRAGEEQLIVETLAGDALDARASVIDIAEGGALTRVVMQHGDGVALSFARVRLGPDARFHQFTLAEGARLARIETHVDVVGAGASVAINGVYMCSAERHADLTSIVTHAAPGASTRQLVKGVVRRGGRGVFQGKIDVARGAQKTDARQHHHGLMLDDGAEIMAKPELMIFADDVACAHGNTAGALDETALFYARSRGIPENRARAMLVEAFLAAAIPDWLGANEREAARERIGAWLGAIA